MAFYQGGGRRALPSMVFSRPGSGQPGLLADELWPVPQPIASGGGSYGLRRAAPKDDSPESTDKSVDASADDRATGLPESVINQYDKLDQEGRDYLTHGPRSFKEQLAYTQWVRPDAYQDARVASPEDQRVFQQSRAVDWANNFVGPDGVVYVRDHWLGEEKPEARIFRAYEKMVGGFKRPKLNDLLDQFDLPDPTEGYSSETKAKIADNEQFNRPISADEKAWRAWAREQSVNPDTWFVGERRPEGDQTGYQTGDSRDLAPAWGQWYFIGPDGIVYERNTLTRPDRATAVSKALEERWGKEALRDAPIEEIVDRALASGAFLPGSNLGRTTPSASKYAALSPRVTQESTDWLLSRKLIPFVANPDGGVGKTATQEQLARLAEQTLRANPTWKQIGGGNMKEKAVRGLFGSNSGSYRGDLIFETPTGDRVVLETTDVDARGKETKDEWNKSLYGFLRGAGNVYNVPKEWQLYRDLDAEAKERSLRQARYMRNFQSALRNALKDWHTPARDSNLRANERLYGGNTLWDLLRRIGNMYSPDEWEMLGRDADDDPRR